MIQINDPAYWNLYNEKSVTLDGYDGSRIYIHPWLSGINRRPSSEVCITAGDDDCVRRDGSTTGDEGWGIAIVNRSEFVEAILAVFPELVRA